MNKLFKSGDTPYCCLELSALLYKLGCNLPGKALIHGMFYPDSEIRNWNADNNVCDGVVCTCPSIMDVQRWLKTNHNIHVEVNLTLGPSLNTVYMDDYTYRIITANPKSDIGQVEYPLHGGFSDFDEALHAGILRAVKMIKKDN